jgi:hypothetical protein
MVEKYSLTYKLCLKLDLKDMVEKNSQAIEL